MCYCMPAVLFYYPTLLVVLSLSPPVVKYGKGQQPPKVCSLNLDLYGSISCNSIPCSADSDWQCIGHPRSA